MMWPISHTSVYNTLSYKTETIINVYQIDDNI